MYYKLNHAIGFKWSIDFPNDSAQTLTRLWKMIPQDQHSHEICALWIALDNPQRVGFMSKTRFEFLINENRTTFLSHASPGSLPANNSIPDTYTLSLHETARALDALLDSPYLLRTYGQMAKPGKLLKKLFPTVTDDEAKAFSDEWKRLTEPDDLHFEIWNDIVEVYTGRSFRFPDKGTISSCMTGSNASLERFTENAGAAVLVLLDDQDEILARALYWPNVDFTDGYPRRPLIDRIYYSYDHHVELFLKWARENGCYAKAEQNYTAKERFISPTDGSSFVSTAIITGVPDPGNGEYPYMDTFTYFNPDTAALYNAPLAGCIALESINGFIDELHESQVYLEAEDRWIDEDDAVVTVDGNFIHIDDAIRIRCEFYPRDHPDIVLLESGEYAHIDDAICTENGEWYLCDDCDVVTVDNDGETLFYHINDPEVGTDYQYAEDDGQYYPTEMLYKCEMADEYYLLISARNARDTALIEIRDRQLNLIS